MKISLTTAARDDYAAAYRYGVDVFGIAQAEAYLDRLDAAFALIALNPGIGRARPEYGHGIRSLIIGSHLAFYQADDTPITILRLRHQHEDWLDNTPAPDAPSGCAYLLSENIPAGGSDRAASAPACSHAA